MTAPTTDRDQLVALIADQISTDPALFDLARRAAPSPTLEVNESDVLLATEPFRCRYQLHTAPELMTVRTEYHRYPSMWSRQRWRRGVGHLSGGATVAGTGYVVANYLAPMVADLPIHILLSVVGDGLGIAGGAVLAVVGVGHLVAPSRVHREAVWRRRRCPRGAPRPHHPGRTHRPRRDSHSGRGYPGAG